MKYNVVYIYGCTATCVRWLNCRKATAKLVASLANPRHSVPLSFTCVSAELTKPPKTWAELCEVISSSAQPRLCIFTQPIRREITWTFSFLNAIMSETSLLFFQTTAQLYPAIRRSAWTLLTLCGDISVPYIMPLLTRP